MRLHHLAISCLGFSILAIAGWSVYLVGNRQQGEVWLVTSTTLDEASSHAGLGGGGARLVMLQLEAGQRASFELCAQSPMLAENWQQALSVAIWRPQSQSLLTRVDFTDSDLARVQRNAQSSCLLLAEGVIEESGQYALDALWENEPTRLRQVPLTIQVQARQSLSEHEGLVFGGLWAAGLSLCLLLGFPLGDRLEEAWREEGEREDEASPADKRPWVRLLLASLGVLIAYFATSFLPPGAAYGLAAGLFLAATQLVFACGLVPGSRRLLARLRWLGLGVFRVRPWKAWLAAVCTAVALVKLARVSTSWVPSTAESPIQHLIAWPSGLLSFAFLALIAPVAEEIFFRGFVYKVLSEKHPVLGFLAAWLLFSFAHGAQTWGQWGALVAIMITGFSLTLLRAWSGSTAASTFAHLLYNGALASGALAAAS